MDYILKIEKNQGEWERNGFGPTRKETYEEHR